MTTRKEHWENVYATRLPNEASWTQQVPQISLDFIHSFHLPNTASIIDVGGGDSRLVDHLLEEGFENITVLDISEKAIGRAKQRLGDKALRVNWIVSDVLDFRPEGIFDCWHDRATFHFLTEKGEVDAYLDTASRSVSRFMVLGTFSDKGPEKCSMLDVHRYSETELQQRLENGFEKIRCVTEDHITPSNKKQNFLFCSFRKKS